MNLRPIFVSFVLMATAIGYECVAFYWGVYKLAIHANDQMMNMVIIDEIEWAKYGIQATIFFVAAIIVMCRR